MQAGRRLNGTFQIRLYDRFVAFRTDAVAELPIQMAHDVFFELLPGVSIAPDILTICASGNEALQLADLRERLPFSPHDLRARVAVGSPARLL